MDQIYISITFVFGNSSYEIKFIYFRITFYNNIWLYLFTKIHTESGGGAIIDTYADLFDSKQSSCPRRAFSRSTACLCVLGKPSKINPGLIVLIGWFVSCIEIFFSLDALPWEEGIEDFWGLVPFGSFDDCSFFFLSFSSAVDAAA